MNVPPPCTFSLPAGGLSSTDCSVAAVSGHKPRGATKYGVSRFTRLALGITLLVSHTPLFCQAHQDSAGPDSYNEVIAHASLSCDSETDLGLQAGIRELRRLIPELASTGDRRAKARALMWLGLCLANTTNPAEALVAYREAANLFELIKDDDHEALALTGAAGAYGLLGRYDEAIKILNTQALPLRQKSNDLEGTAATLNQLGVIWIDIGDYDQAIATLQLAVETADAANVDQFKGATRGNLGFALILRGEYVAAKRNLEAALAFFGGRSRGRSFVLYFSGRLNQQTNHTGEALRFYREAIETSRLAGDRRVEVAALYARASIELGIGQFTRANEGFSAALLSAYRYGLKELEARCAGGVMNAYQAQERRGAAILFGKESVNTYQDIRAALRSYDSRTERLFVESHLVTYRTLIELLVEAGRIPEAQQVLSLLKEEEVWTYTRGDSRVVKKAQTACATSPHVGRTEYINYTPKECELESQYHTIADDAAVVGKTYYDLKSVPERTPQQDAELQQVYDKVVAINGHFQMSLKQIARELGRARGDKLLEVTESQSLMQTLAEMPENAVVVYALVLPKKLRLILITPTVQIARESMISSAELNKAVFLMRSQCQDPHSDPRNTSKNLYDLVFLPIAADIKQSGAKVIMWSLDGVLRYAPMSALYDGTHYLVEHYQMVFFTAASRDSLRDSVLSDWTGIGFGISKPIAGFVGLPDVPAELYGIFGSNTDLRRRHGIYKGDVYIDEAFDKATLQKSLLRKLSLVHFATHFSLSPGTQDDSFLLMGTGDHFTLRDMRIVPNVFSGTDLLTLSACETAVPQATSDGVEVESFGVLAQRQGAKAVLATLWDVADASTTDFMLEFYSEKKSMVTKAAAIQGAQLSIMKRSKYAHPYFWAPFVLYGNWK